MPMISRRIALPLILTLCVPQSALGLRPAGLEDEEILQELTGHGSTVMSLAISPDGKRLASGGLDQDLRVWDLSGEKSNLFDKARLHEKAHADLILALAFISEDELISAGLDNVARRWKMDFSGPHLLNHFDLVKDSRALAMSSTGRRLAAGSPDGSIHIWDTSTGEKIQKLSKPEKLKYPNTPDMQLIQRFYKERGQTLSTENPVIRLAFSRDGNRLAAAYYNQTLRIWDLSTGNYIRPTSIKRKTQGMEDIRWIQSLAFSPDGSRLAAGSQDGTIHIWDAANGQMLARLKEHNRGVHSLAFASDGKLASGGVDGLVHLWQEQAEGWKSVANFFGQKYGVFAVAFSPDGRKLIAAGGDHSIKIWTLQAALTGAEETWESLSSLRLKIWTLLSQESKELTSLTATIQAVWETTAGAVPLTTFIGPVAPSVDGVNRLLDLIEKAQSQAREIGQSKVDAQKALAPFKQREPPAWFRGVEGSFHYLKQEGHGTLNVTLRSKPAVEGLTFAEKEGLKQLGLPRDFRGRVWHVWRRHLDPARPPGSAFPSGPGQALAFLRTVAFDYPDAYRLLREKNYSQAGQVLKPMAASAQELSVRSWLGMLRLDQEISILSWKASSRVLGAQAFVERKLRAGAEEVLETLEYWYRVEPAFVSGKEGFFIIVDGGQKYFMETRIGSHVVYSAHQRRGSSQPDLELVTDEDISISIVGLWLFAHKHFEREMLLERPTPNIPVSLNYTKDAAILHLLDKPFYLFNRADARLALVHSSSKPSAEDHAIAYSAACIRFVLDPSLRQVALSRVPLSEAKRMFTRLPSEIRADAAGAEERIRNAKQLVEAYKIITDAAWALNKPVMTEIKEGTDAHIFLNESSIVTLLLLRTIRMGPSPNVAIVDPDREKALRAIAEAAGDSDDVEGWAQTYLVPYNPAVNGDWKRAMQRADEMIEARLPGAIPEVVRNMPRIFEKFGTELKAILKSMGLHFESGTFDRSVIQALFTAAQA